MVEYSGKSLVAKLGVAKGFRIAVIDSPVGFSFSGLPSGVVLGRGRLDFVIFFARDRSELESKFSELKRQLSRTGMLWIAWQKQVSGLNEGDVRAIGLANGLVDVKVCAIDERWSGLKFVYRLEDRGNVLEKTEHGRRGHRC